MHMGKYREGSIGISFARGNDWCQNDFSETATDTASKYEFSCREGSNITAFMFYVFQLSVFMDSTLRKDMLLIRFKNKLYLAYLKTTLFKYDLLLSLDNVET